MRYEGSEGAVSAKCPVCGVVVPMLTVTAHRYGFLGRRVAVIVDGDATDFVAHLWMHRMESEAKSDI